MRNRSNNKRIVQPNIKSFQWTPQQRGSTELNVENITAKSTLKNYVLVTA